MTTPLPPRSIAVVLGTRPEMVKLSGIIGLLGEHARIVHTGQHFSASMSEVFFADLGLRDPDLRLEIGGRSRGEQIASATLALDHHLRDDPPAAVVVQGDTNTVLAGALAANAREVPLVHVEAGLRSRDRAMPEEHNRVVTDHLADLCLAPTSVNTDNLLAEGIDGARIVLTGNTVVEAVQRITPDPDDRHLIRQQIGLGLEVDGYVLSTFHRPENVDDPDVLATILSALADLQLPCVLPMHPRTRIRIESFGLHDLLEALVIVPPVGYRDFLGLAADAALLVSDSGGVQEEASVLKRPVVVVRNSTERPEVLGTFADLVQPGEAILTAAERWLDDVAATRRELQQIPSPYGDGTASQRSVDAMLAMLGASS